MKNIVTALAARFVCASHLKPSLRLAHTCFPSAILGFLLGLAPAVVHGAGKGPAHYIKRDTWHQTMLASLEALEKSDLVDVFPPYESGTFHGGQPAQRVSINIIGAKELYLFVTGVPDVKWGVGDWADARLVRKDGSSTPVSRLNNLEALLGMMEKDLTLRAGLYQKLRLGGRQFESGLNVLANSIVQVPLEDDYERFEAWIGVDDWASSNGSVRFSVVGSRTAARKQLFQRLALDFPEATPRQQLAWEREDRLYEFEWATGGIAKLAQRYAKASHRVPPLAAQASGLAASVRDEAGLERVRELYYQSRQLDRALSQARDFDFEALRLAIEDLGKSFAGRYPAKFATRFTQLEESVHAALTDFNPTRLASFEKVARLHAGLEALKREALLANPLLDFDRLLVIKRIPHGDPRRPQLDRYGLGEFVGMPRQSSWNYGTMPNVEKWTNEIALLSPVHPDGRLTTLFAADRPGLVADVDLHWNADKLLFSMPDRRKNWQVHELALDRAQARSHRQLTADDHPDVHNYDASYLPNGDILFLSTAPLQGVPCNASVIVGMTYRMDRDGRNICQITFEQDHDYTPSIMNDGRVLYLRWDYTDTPHIWNRVLMTMNPDGTGQMSYYGGNSYWPNAFFYARAIPNDPEKIISIITGHHEGRIGELVLIDPGKGLRETDGVVQRIPGRGRPVEPKIEDKLTEHSWPKFLHPWPLNDKYFLVACKPEPESLWGIYLVDVFDNRVLVKEEEHFALFEPIPFRQQPVPPVIVDKVSPDRADALVYLQDIYSGPGLKDVPRGSVKSLRLFTYHFAYQTLAGIDDRVGADGPWEAKRVLGTVPVEEDGSALFHVPAKLPISLQPLDAEGKALALMRSWMTALPGENLSCVGCHDRADAAPLPTRKAIALTRPPSEIRPWRGSVRGFSFAREVQPVLDKYCVGCHDGQTPPDLRRDQDAYLVFEHGKIDGQIIRGRTKQELLGKYSAVFEPSYAALRQYVRVGGLESDLHVLPPKEFHTDTSELIQMLLKGHHNVRLDAEAWDRLSTWIDLNAPCHGTWSEVTRLPGRQRERRLELARLYAGVVEDCEVKPEAPPTDVTPILPEPESKPAAQTVSVPGWPLSAEQARQSQAAEGPVTRAVDLGGGVTMEFVRIPAGAFVMGDTNGARDERQLSPQRIERPFWMAKFEVSNEQFRRFNPAHDSRFEHRSSWIFSEEYLGWPLNQPRQPVVRVSWQEAMDFCRWLSQRLGAEVTLPTEAQWEYACRAGSASPFSYGDADTDFARFANLGDASLRKLADEGWRPKAPDLVVRDSRFDDGALVTAPVGSYVPNVWGLHDMHGNVAEWTRSPYLPAMPTAGLSTGAADDLKVVRGGSWRDRPRLCRSASRWRYPAWQKVFNVGFRVVCETDALLARATPSIP